MKQLLFIGSLICVAFLIAGSVWFPNSILMELAGNSLALNIFRGLTIVLLFAVLVTEPPRSVMLRLFMGLSAAGFIFTSLSILFSDSMHFLDILLYAALGCALGIEALEFDESELLPQAATNSASTSTT